MIECASRDGTQSDLIDRADREPRRQRIGLRLVIDLQAEPDVAQRHADPQRTAGPHAELSAEIEPVRHARSRGKVAAVAAAIDPKLHELVADPEHERAREVRRVGREEFEVARRDARDRVAVLVGAIEVAVIDEIDRAADHADAARGKIRPQHVAAAGDQRRAVQRELIVRQCGESRGIPEGRFPPPCRSGGRLAHPDGLRADGKHEKQRAGVEGRLLSAEYPRRGDDRREQNPAKKASPHR